MRLRGKVVFVFSAAAMSCGSRSSSDTDLLYPAGTDDHVPGAEQPMLVSGVGDAAAKMESVATDAAVGDSGTRSDGARAPLGGDVAPCYHLDPAHTGRHLGGSLRPPLTRRWTTDLEAAISYPVVAMNRVFVTVQTAPMAPRVKALDAGSGTVLWEAPATALPSHGIDCAYDRGKVFTSTWDGQVKGFDAVTGAELWSITPFYGFTSPPTPADGVLYVSGAASGTNAFDEGDGHRLWAEYGGSESPPTVDGGLVFATSGCFETKAFDVGNGASRWHYYKDCSGGGGETAAVFGSRLYVRNDNAFQGTLALSAATGAVAGTWSDATMVPAFDGDVGFFVQTRPRKLAARRLADETTLWEFAGDGDLASEAIVVNGYVYVVSQKGTLYALDEKSGVVAWSDETGYAIPDFSRGVVLVPHVVLAPRVALAATDTLLLIPAGNSLVVYGPSP